MGLIEQRADAFVGMQQSYETRRAYGRDLRVWFDFIGSPALVTEEDAIRFRDYLVQTYAPNGAARVWNTVRSFYKFARYPENPFEYVKAPKRVVNQTPRTPSDEDVEALVAAGADKPQRALVIALLLNGLRASEVRGLLKTNVERHEGATILRVIGKGNKERLIPATVEAETAIVRFAETCSDAQRDSKYVVPDVDGNKLSLQAVERHVYKAAEYAGVEGMHPHALRHHYATRLIRNGVETPYVQRLLGHASISTTQTYIGLDLADLIEATKKDPRNKSRAERIKVIA